MIGTFTTPTKAKIALALSARRGSSIEARNAIKPKYRKRRIKEGGKEHAEGRTKKSGEICGLYRCCLYCPVVAKGSTGRQHNTRRQGGRLLKHNILLNNLKMLWLENLKMAGADLCVRPYHLYPPFFWLSRLLYAYLLTDVPIVFKNLTHWNIGEYHRHNRNSKLSF